jgi:hypothetical protein
MIEALDDEPLLLALMGACSDIILQAFPCLNDGLIHELMKPREVKMYRILSHSSDSECAADLQELLKMSISIL